MCRQELMSLRRELDGLSDRYSQKCLELNREQQNNGEKERQISMKEREMEQLRRQNQVMEGKRMKERETDKWGSEGVTLWVFNNPPFILSVGSSVSFNRGVPAYALICHRSEVRGGHRRRQQGEISV